MYIKFEEGQKGRYFTFFAKEKKVMGEMVNFTDKSVFATLSEGIKTGENNGKVLWENDYWDTIFCGKAYQEALNLKDKDKIVVKEMIIRNRYVKEKKKSYPQIMVTDFVIDDKNAGLEGFEEVDGETPF